MITFRSQTEKRIFEADMRRFEKMKPFLCSEDKILKVGAGLGFQAQILEDFFPGKVTIAEVENKLHPEVKVPIVLYDGVKLPFKNEEFGVAIANHVLHHTPDPTVVLYEISRTTSKKIIVIEELWTNRLQWLSIIANCWYKGYKTGDGFAKLYIRSYKSEKEWLNIFQKSELEIEFRSDSKTSDKLINFRVGFFVLKKK